MLFRFTVLGAGVLIAGYAFSAKLYQRRHKRLRGSDLETKILMWVPIYLVTLLFVVGNTPLRLAIIGLVLIQSWRDLLGHRLTKPGFKPAATYALIVSAGMISSIGIINTGRLAFLSVWFMSVLSDVTAFFAGNYLGRHPLPSDLNRQKSWEGVAGQLLGALIGFGLIHVFVAGIPFYLAITAGVGSGAGDLANSYLKRKVRLKQWSNRLPGHGGFLDRFSSMGIALLLSYLALL